MMMMLLPDGGGGGEGSADETMVVEKAMKRRRIWQFKFHLHFAIFSSHTQMGWIEIFCVSYNFGKYVNVGKDSIN